MSVAFGSASVVTSRVLIAPRPAQGNVFDSRGGGRITRSAGCSCVRRPCSCVKLVPKLAIVRPDPTALTDMRFRGTPPKTPARDCGSGQMMDIFGRCIDLPNINPRINVQIRDAGKVEVDQSRDGALSDPAQSTAMARERNGQMTLLILGAIVLAGFVLG